MERFLEILEKLGGVILAALLQTDYKRIISLVRANEKMHRSQKSGQYEFVVSDAKLGNEILNPSAFQLKEKADVQISLNLTEIRFTAEKLSKSQKRRVNKYCDLIDDFESAVTVSDWKKYEREIVELLASLQLAHRSTRRRRLILAIVFGFAGLVLLRIALSVEVLDFADVLLQRL